MKFIIRTVLVIVSLVVLLFAGAAIMLATFNPNDFKPQLAEAVKKSTGRDLVVNGDIKVVFYPVLGLEAQKLTLSNPPGFSETEFLSVGTIQAGVNILPLLQKKIEITKVYLDAPSITVIKQANGTNNLSFTKPGAAAQSGTAPSETTAPAKTKDMQLSIEGIEIKNAKVVSRDLATGKTTTVDPLNLSLPGFTPGRKTPFEMNFVLTGDGLPPAKVTLSGTADVNAKAETAEITNLKLNANGTDLTGDFSVKGFKKPAVTFNAKAASLDLDSLMRRPAVTPSPAGAAESKAATSRKAANDDKPLLPVNVLRDLTLNGDVAVGTLLFNGLSMSDMKIKITADKGLVKADPLTMSFYGGAFSSALQIDVRGASPTINLTGDLKNLQVGGLVKAKAGEEYLTGLANSDFNLSMRGNTMRDLRSSAGGDVKATFGDGYINKWELSKFLNQAINYLETGNFSAPAADNIKFTSLNFSLQGSNGVFRNSDLQMIGPKSHALGSGMIDLASETVDYTIGVGQGDNPEKFAKKTRIPVRISGPFSAPKYNIDFQALAVDRINRKKDELIDKAVDKLLGGKKSATPATTDGTTTAAPEAGTEPAPKSNEEIGKELLKGLLGGGR